MRNTGRGTRGTRGIQAAEYAEHAESGVTCRMPTIEYLHVCDSAFMAEGGKHCIIGIFDVIFAQSFPANHASMSVAMRVRGQAHETVSLRIQLARPNGDVLATVPADITLDPSGSAFLNVNMMGTTFPEQGRYLVKVLASGQTLVSHPLTLQKAQTPPVGQQGAPPKVH